LLWVFRIFKFPFFDSNLTRKTLFVSGLIFGVHYAGNSFGDFARDALIRSAVNTTMAIAVDGVKPGEAIRQGAMMAAVDTMASYLSNKIG
jgi:hypothetical protein